MNELTIVENIDKRLRAKNPINVFPLTPTHRKELRKLKSVNIGDLTDRLGTIKKLKLEEYKNKYFSDTEKQLTDYSNLCKKLNDDWSRVLIKINKIFKSRREFEKKHNSKILKCETSYDGISGLKDITDAKRVFSYNMKSVAENILNEKFKKKYGEAFDEVRKQIDDINTKYEEAINFGDLEIVKELYYTMKSADILFIKIDSLKI